MKRIKLDIVKVLRSHATQAMVDAHVIADRDRTGNDMADEFAEKGAAIVKPPDTVVA